jgi:dolichol-phosphate mannosyltransferase
MKSSRLLLCKVCFQYLSYTLNRTVLLIRVFCLSLVINMIVAVVIPCFRVKEHIVDVIKGMGCEVSIIVAVDDCCPEGTADHIESTLSDPRLRVLRHTENQGVGGATISGYRHALIEGADIVVKIDGDGQMDPSLIPSLIKPILKGKADYCKGSRFFDLESLVSMPKIRLVGNSILSFVNKVSSGYWDIMDPTNGFTAIHRTALALLPLSKISKRYFFESDMLFRLGTLRAVVCDRPMKSKYGDEKSGISALNVLFEFPFLYFLSFLKRIFYNYILRDFNGGSMQLFLGLLLLGFGGLWGVSKWLEAEALNVAATSGTVMIAVLPIILGFQLLLSAIQFDMTNVPREPLQQSA